MTLKQVENSKYASRKFLLSVSVFICTTIFAFMGKVSGSDITIIYSIVLGGHHASNLLEGKIKPKKDD
jgi:hypothetical protein